MLEFVRGLRYESSHGVIASVAAGTKWKESERGLQHWYRVYRLTGGVKDDLKFISCAHHLARVQNYKPCKVEASHSQKGNFKSAFVCHSGLEWSAVKWSSVLFNTLYD